MDPTKPNWESTRETMHRVCAHVLARRRFDVSGHFGLRASPGGVTTPAFGPEPESIRIAGAVMAREIGGAASLLGLNGATLRQLADFAGADIDINFSCGPDAPEVGDPDEPISLELGQVIELADWCQLGWRILDSALALLPPEAEPATLQLWPEHFDIGTNVRLGGNRRANLGCSPGDSFESEPYLYVGPWGSERPGDAGFWNAPFGAVVRRSELASAADPVKTGLAFVKAGLEKLTADAGTILRTEGP